MSVEEKLTSPSLRWRAGSTATILFTATLAKLFLNAACRTETQGLDGFIKLLEEREDVAGRERGLLTVSNHVSVVDDPLVWGFLPYRFLANPDSMRWSLGSYDICFKDGSSNVLSKYFSLGQTLPTHRSLHSEHGGLFQPTITQCIRLLSRGPFTTPTPPHPGWIAQSSEGHEVANAQDISDPFTDPTFTYTTTGSDSFHAPSAYGTRRHSWVHIFPEGKVHQHPDKSMRYMKWGVARLILEAEPCPTVVPMWIEGPEEVMHEAREFPRFLPRVGKTINVTYGDPVSETVWAGFRERWRRLREKHVLEADVEVGGGALTNAELMDGKEASDLRTEVAFVVREEVLKLRRRRGWPDEDPKARYIDTWREEGGKSEGEMEDGSWVKDT